MGLSVWCAAMLATVAVGVGGGRQPAPLRGAPLDADTGLRLLVADNPPFILDVDSGASTRVRGLKAIERDVVSVVAAAGRAGIVVSDSGRQADIFSIRGRPPRLARLGLARDVISAGDGRTVWLKAEVGSGCVLRQVRLDGTATGARRSFPCGWLIQPGGSLGVVARRTLVIDPATGRTIYRARFGVLAAAGRKLLLDGPQRQFTLVDVESGIERRVRWPSILGGMDRPAVDPRGRYIALAFADPAWGVGVSCLQASDIWLLDTGTSRLTQVPGMPACVSLKRTSMEWTDDGRLVLLGEDRDGSLGFVALWRPGQRWLAVKRLKLPQRSGGSDSFASIW